MFPRSCSSRRGFTLVELLAVVTILAVMAGLVLPVLGGLKTKARSARCFSQMHQFGLAIQVYATDWEDAFPPNRIGQNVPRGATWVNGWVTPRSPDGTNRVLLHQSLLSRYLGDDALWQCPGDRSQIELPDGRYDRVRSISMNYYMGANWTSPMRLTYQKLSDLIRPNPNEAFVFTDESPDSINDGAFAVDANFQARRPEDWHLIDLPGIFHGRGTGMAFADAHSEIHLWSDTRTADAARTFQVLSHNKDLQWMDLHSSAPPEAR